MSKLKHIGLYFGSFNPIHVGHLILADYVAQNHTLDEVWLVVSPQNPLKNKKGLLEDHHRLQLVRLAVEDNPRLKASNIEFGLPQPNYTVNTLAHLDEKYPDYQFSLIMGEDNLRNFHKWKNHQDIISKHKLLVYKRILTGSELKDDEQFGPTKWHSHANVMLMDGPLMKISASYIRNAIKNGEDVKYLLSPPVEKYVEEMHFYKK